MPELTMPEKPKPDFTDPIKFPAGVKLTPPTKSNPAYRVEHYDPPRGLQSKGIEPGKRSWKGSNADLDIAYRNACRLSRQLFRKVTVLTATGSGGLRLSQPWQDVITEYLDDTNQPKWTDGADGSYAKQQRSLAINWLGWVDPNGDETEPVRRIVADAETDITFCELPVGSTTHLNLLRATKPVYELRAYNTYKNVDKLVRSLVLWAAKSKYLDASDATALLLAFNIRAKNEDDDSDVVTEDKIPPRERLLEFRSVHGQLHGTEETAWRYELESDMMTWMGLRDGELLAIRNVKKQFEDLDGDEPRLYVFKRVDANGKLKPPKWKKKRYVTIPEFLVEPIRRRLAELEDGEPFFPSPTGCLYGTNNWRSRRFEVTAKHIDWPVRADYCPHEDHDEDGCEGQNRRRWLWPPHSLRHHAVTWTLLPVDLGGLGWDDTDAAEHFGHDNPADLRRMYQEVLPKRHRRRHESTRGVNPLA